MSEQRALPQDLRAIVLDTNCMGDGALNLGVLQGLAKVLSKTPEIEVWIPEPVMLEWASHARQDFTDLYVKVRGRVRKLAQAGTHRFAAVGIQPSGDHPSDGDEFIVLRG